MKFFTALRDHLFANPPNVEVLAKRAGKSILFRYKLTACEFIISILVSFSLIFFTQINRLPQPHELVRFKGQILETSKTDPHLLLRLADGLRITAEWPVSVGPKGGLYSDVWTDEQREKLRGCMVHGTGTPLIFTLDERFRIWELYCDERAIQIGF